MLLGLDKRGEEVRPRVSGYDIEMTGFDRYRELTDVENFRDSAVLMLTPGIVWVVVSTGDGGNPGVMNDFAQARMSSPRRGRPSMRCAESARASKFSGISGSLAPGDPR